MKKYYKQAGVIIFIAALFLSGFFFFNKKIVDSDAGYTREKLILLGRYLFYDRRLSINNTKSCATCHNPQFAFTDGYKRSLGAFADLHQRNTQPLFNLTYLKYLTAADSSLHSPLQQMDNPLFNTHPAELGIQGHEVEILKRIAADSLYNKMFAAAFSGEAALFSLQNIKTAISYFVLMLKSGNSPYDKYKNGDSSALTVFQKKGMQLFFSSQLKCFNCHGGFNFSAPNIKNEKGDTLYYFNTGLYNINGKGLYPLYDEGLYQHTKNIKDMGGYRVATLRNLAFTAPYFHDGSAASLTEVVDVYAAGGRKIVQGINKGDGTANPYKHTFLHGFNLAADDKINLISFLLSLSDSSFVSNPQYQNPFTEDETRKKY